jgi:hypothetical protein
MTTLTKKFQQYNEWRRHVVNALQRYRAWTHAANTSDIVTEQYITHLLEKLSNDKLTIAFVAEFSRGKSELINAIFFSEYGQRVLPSSVGRTTMCPTELLYDEAFPPCIKLLPIETRTEPQTVSELKLQNEAWTTLPLDVDSLANMLEIFKQVSMSKKVSVATAQSYGLYNEENSDAVAQVDEANRVEIPQWRHAIINFPHPLLKDGLIIIDTPGLNAIGTEPELTLNLIPNAHAVLFILAADTGVTKSDIEIWRSCVGPGPGRIVVLNKIDSMWDELRSEEEIESQLNSQITLAAQLLSVDEKQIFPISAQKALVGKIQNNAPLLAKSRLLKLEYALSDELLPSKQEIIRSQLGKDIHDLLQIQHALLSTRHRDVFDQLAELKSLRGKNRQVIEQMLKQVEADKQAFDQSIVKLQGIRSVFTRLSTEILTSLGMDILKEEIQRTRRTMESSTLSTGMVHAVQHFFSHVRRNLTLSHQKTNEIFEMMSIMYKKFSHEYGLTLSNPMPFSFDKYHAELEAVEAVFQKKFGVMTLLTTSRVALIQRFFDSITTRVKQCFAIANRDVEVWQKAVMAPLEAQLKEHKSQLKKRMHSIQRINVAADDLEDKIMSLEVAQSEIDGLRAGLAELGAEIATALSGAAEQAAA